MPSTSIHIVSRDRGFARMLYGAIAAETARLFLVGRRPQLPRFTSRNRADILIHAFDRAEMDDPSFSENEIEAMEREGHKVRVFLQLASPEVHGPARMEIDEKNRTIEAMALRCGAHFVAMNYVLRMGATRWFSRVGRPNLLGYVAIAHMVLRTVRAQTLRVATQGKLTGGNRLADDIPSAAVLLEHLSWPHPSLPKNLARSYSRETIADFTSGIVSFPAWPGWGKFALADPIDWAMPGANWSWQSYFTGLEFMRPALCLAFDHARGGPIPPDIQDVLNAKGITEEDVFRRASFMLADFARNNPPPKPANQRAYFQGTMCRRLKAILTYLVVCKARLDRGLPVENAEVDLAVQNLVQCFEMLYTDEVYPKGDNHGLRQDVLFILAGLLFPDLAYGKKLMKAGIGRLERHQLGKALSADGVWLENSYGYHCLIMNQLGMLLTDLRLAGVPESRFICGALARMLPFAEGLIKMDGTSPLIGDTAPSRHLSTVAAARREIVLANGQSGTREDEEAGFVREKATYYFPQSGYFASYSGRELSPQSSSVIFTATLRNPKHKHSDDLSIVFSRGATDLLVDGGTFNKEISDSVRNAARYDPASHNTFRVNNGGYPLRVIPGTPPPGGLTGMWEGSGWAAARGFNHAYPDARIARTVIHLKAHNALLVFDFLASKTAAEVLFEQFWHISPDFIPAKDSHGPLFAFRSKSQGLLLAGFEESGPAPTVDFGTKENPIAWMMKPGKGVVATPYLRRAVTCQNATMASIFQWMDSPAEIAIGCHATGQGKFDLLARGRGFEARFSIRDSEIACVALKEHSADKREFA